MEQPSPARPEDLLAQFLAPIPLEQHLRPLRVRHCRVGPNWWTQTEVFNDDLRLLFIRSGRGRYWANGEEIALRRGSAICLLPGSRFQLAADPRALPQVVACRILPHLNATGRAAPVAMTGGHLKLGAAGAPSSQARGRMSLLESLFLQLAHDFSALQRRHEPAALSWCNHATSSSLHLILQHFIQQAALTHASDCTASRSVQDVLHQAIEVLCERIDHQPLEEVDWQQEASKLGCSLDRLRRQFAKLVGRTPYAYQLSAKMAHAAFLLDTTACTVADAAEALGYSDPFVFSRQFKRTTGQSPSEWRA